MLLCIFLLMSFIAPGQQLKGRILDERSQPLPGALVQSAMSEINVFSAADGLFTLEISRVIPFDTLRISFLGYKKEQVVVNFRTDTAIVVQMTPDRLSLQEVVVKHAVKGKFQQQSALNVEVADDQFLRQNISGSLMKSLERLPGVSAFTIGSGQSKPMIRGLGFNRVVVMENGIRHEGQQWGQEHGLEIDQHTVESVEIIKGPASLIAGSDAIGGLINLRQNSIPEPGSFQTGIFLGSQSNDSRASVSASLMARPSEWFYAVRATITDYADFKIPADSVDVYSFRVPLHRRSMRNTAGHERSIQASVGRVSSNWIQRLYVSRYAARAGFFANAHGLEPRSVDVELHDRSNRDIQYPYHEVVHWKINNSSDFKFNSIRLTVEAAWQLNSRKEWSSYVSHGYMPATFPDTLSFLAALERAFQKHIGSINMNLNWERSERFSLQTGLNTELQHNTIEGRNFLIPAYKQKSAGSFVYIKQKIGSNSWLHSGLRADLVKYRTDAYMDWFYSPEVSGSDTSLLRLQRAPEADFLFSNLSWSVGYQYLKDRLAIKLNAGKGFRFPQAAELTANGVNYHHFSFEKGNPELVPEQVFQFDAGLEYEGMRVALGLSPFLSWSPNFIYLNPTPFFDRLYGNGNQVFQYTQSAVLRAGGELHAHLNVLPVLMFGIIAEYAYSEQLNGPKKGFGLPFSPPASALLHLRFKPISLLGIEQFFVSADLRLAAAQRRIVPPEVTTPGWHSVNLSAGGRIFIGKQQLQLNLLIENLTNNKFFNHSSYYRIIQIPEPGINFKINVLYSFNNNH